MLLLNKLLPNSRHSLPKHFNTSYVVIKPMEEVAKEVDETYFNTSYVVIKLLHQPHFLHFQKYFNTSYVVIKQGGWIATNSITAFQYILCCY